MSMISISPSVSSEFPSPSFLPSLPPSREDQSSSGGLLSPAVLLFPLPFLLSAPALLPCGRGPLRRVPLPVRRRLLRPRRRAAAPGGPVEARPAVARVGGGRCACGGVLSFFFRRFFDFSVAAERRRLWRRRPPRGRKGAAHPRGVGPVQEDARRHVAADGGGGGVRRREE